MVRAREAAKKDQLRARHRLSKFLLRHGRRPATTMKPWTGRHLQWLETVRFDHAAQEVTRRDYLHEVEHAAARIARLDTAIAEAVHAAPASMRAVIAGLQALRGVAQVTAATIVTEVGTLSRFATPRQLMGYSGAVASEASSAPGHGAAALRKPGTPTCGAWSSKRRGPIAMRHASARCSASARPASPRASPRSRGKRSNGCIGGTGA